MLRWINKPFPSAVEEDENIPVRVAFGHGGGFTYGITMALHGNDPTDIGMSLDEGSRLYRLPNASARVLVSMGDGWRLAGSIMLPDASG